MTTSRNSHVVALINMKGGVGKTTLAVALAWELAKASNVLLVDVDPQFNATQWMLGDDAYLKWLKDKKTIFDVSNPQLGRLALAGSQNRASRRFPQPQTLSPRLTLLVEKRVFM
jgi:chromosome partitioning protein